MSRTPDERNRERLFRRVVSYVAKHGVADLSLRPLAAEVGISPRVLLYHFGSKEELIAEVLMRAGDRQRDLVARLQTRFAGSIEGCREIWRSVSDPQSLPVFVLFFEVYGLAMREPRRFATYRKNFVVPWLRFIGDPLVQFGWSRGDADAYATLVIAAFRGFLLDLCATGDRARVDAAVELWLQTLPAAGAEKELAS